MTTEKKLSGPTEIEPANRKRSLTLPPDAELTAVAGRLVDQARDEGIALTGEGGLLTGLIQQVRQTALEAELTEHLGYEPHAVEGRGSGNSRNGYYLKTVRTEIGEVTVEIPRDRNGSLEPVTIRSGNDDEIKKLVTQLSGIVEILKHADPRTAERSTGS